MRNLVDGACYMVIERCETIGKPLDDQQVQILRSALEQAINLSNRSDEDILELCRYGQLPEKLAAFWLDMDRLTLWQKFEGS